MKKEDFVVTGNTIPYQDLPTNEMPEINDIASYQGKTTENVPPSPEEPCDRYHIVRITMYLFGITSLLPWNFFIQANDYWMYKFRNVSIPFNPNTEDKTDLQATFASYLAIASKVPYVLFLLINTAISRRVLPTKRIGYPLAAMIALFVVTTIMVKINTDKNEAAFFAVTICTVVAINSMCGFVQGGGTGVAGSLPKRFMGYNVNGMALGGILASIAQILSLLGDTTPTDSAIIYFLCAVTALCITFIFFRLMLKSEFYQFHMSQQTTTEKKHDSTNKENRNMSQFQIFKKLWIYAVSVTLLFWVTLAVLPAVVVLVVSTSGDQTLWTGRLFLPVACFLLFNVSDLVSRLVALQVMIPPSGKYATLSLALLRIIFIPLLMLCNAQPRSHLPVIFDSDADFIVITMFFGFTNGYLCTVVLTHGPKEVETEHQEIAGSIMAFFLGLGLMLGSVTSYGIVKLL